MHICAKKCVFVRFVSPHVSLVPAVGSLFFLCRRVHICVENVFRGMGSKRHCAGVHGSRAGGVLLQGVPYLTQSVCISARNKTFFWGSGVTRPCAGVHGSGAGGVLLQAAGGDDGHIGPFPHGGCGARD